MNKRFTTDIIIDCVGKSNYEITRYGEGITVTRSAFVCYETHRLSRVSRVVVTVCIIQGEDKDRSAARAREICSTIMCYKSW